LYAYLSDGWHPDHGTARGPMARVVANLAQVPDDDVRAIAAYMAGVFGAPTPERKRTGEEVLAEAAPGRNAPSQSEAARRYPPGAAIYAAACATCHESGRPPPYGGVNPALSSAVTGPDPRNLANIVLSGVRPVEGERSPIMPGFAASMQDSEIAALANFLRARFGNQPAWADVEQVVADARRLQAAVAQAPPPRNAPRDPDQCATTSG
jgi:mono/diheme cytochrome c family protein